MKNFVGLHHFFFLESLHFFHNISYLECFFTLCLAFPPWLKGFTSAHLGEFKRELNSAILKDMRSNKDNISVTVLAVDITRKESEYDLKPSRPYRIGCDQFTVFP